MDKKLQPEIEEKTEQKEFWRETNQHKRHIEDPVHKGI